MVRVYCQECVSEFIVDSYEDHPGLCPKCKAIPCKICGGARKGTQDFCSTKCRMKYHYDQYKVRILAKKKEDYEKRTKL